MRAYFCLIIAVLVILTGCVATQHGLAREADEIFIETTPSGANILINNEFRGISPLTVKLPEGEPSLSIKMMKEGYKTEEVVLAPREQKVDSRKQNIVLNSTLFFGGIGLVAGLASGNPLAGLGGGTLLGLTVGALQEEKDVSNKYEYPQEDIHIILSPLTDK